MNCGKSIIQQFRYGTDNLSYLLHDNKQAVVVDGGAVKDILNFIEQAGLHLRYVLNTHGHADHTVGNNLLISSTGAEHISTAEIIKKKPSILAEWNINVLETPGHSTDSICFYGIGALLSGDTLFNGTIGNCFSGDMHGFFHSLTNLCGLPPTTTVYAGHDYVYESMAFARKLEPGNTYIDAYESSYTPDHVFSTLHDEFQVNPYLRYNQQNILALLKEKHLPVATPYDRWNSLMTIE